MISRTRRASEKLAKDRLERPALKSGSNGGDAESLLDTLQGLISLTSGGANLHRVREFQHVPLSTQVEHFRSHLLAKGDTRKHVDDTYGRVIRMIGAIHANQFSAITAAGIQRAIGAERAKGASLRTCNAYLRAVKSFCRYMIRDGRALFNPLEYLPQFNARIDRRRERRALTEEQLDTLLRVTEAGPSYLSISGGERSLIYFTAVNTGLRANELRLMQKRHLRLLTELQEIVIPAAHSKHRRKDRQPILADLASALADHVAGRSLDSPVFQIPEKTAKMLRFDLERAGIPYQDDDGLVIDFHGLRHTFISRLVRAGVTPNQAKELARHSTIVLTMDFYAHHSLQDGAEALSMLPRLNAPCGTRTYNPLIKRQVTENRDSAPKTAISTKNPTAAKSAGKGRNVRP